MIEKNVNNENRQLRGKLHNLEAENVFLKDKASKLEDVIRVR
jgi:cell division protein FtsB